MRRRELIIDIQRGHSSSDSQFWSNAGRPLAIAHRAGNDLPRLKAAEAIGVDLVEADLWLYRDRVEVRHLKTLGPVPVLWDRWELASARTPRLELARLLSELSPTTRLLLDLKGRDTRLAAYVIEAMVRHRPPDTLAVCSRNWMLLEPFHQAPAVAVAYSIGNRRQLDTYMAGFDRPSPHAVSVHARLLDPMVVSALKHRAVAVISWPVNTDEMLRQFMAWGIDGMTSDNMDVLASLVAS